MRSFRPLFVMAVLMIIGIALIPKLDTAIDPRPVQGKTLTIDFRWPSVSPKVVEQNATSVIEGLVSSVRGVAKTESQSSFGSGRVTVELKPQADVSAAKFEISSMLRQMRSKLPEGMSYPTVTGGEVANEGRDEKRTVTLLTYRIADDIPANILREYVKNRLDPLFMQIDGISGVEVNGGTDLFLEVTYDPEVLARYGITSAQLREAVALHVGDNQAVGEVEENGRRTAIWLATDGQEKPLEHIPVKTYQDGSVVFVNDLALCQYKYKDPDRYYRINGLNTVYLDIKAEAGTNLISLSDRVQREIDGLSQSLGQGLNLELTYDSAEKQRQELGKLVNRSLMALAILLLLVLVVSRSWVYLTLIAITLASAILMAVMGYWLFDIRLHIYSLAGITVSLGLIIDASIVMVDHYKRYRDRGAFFGILAALLTTIGSLVLILFMPDYVRKDLLDFAWIVMINLTCALLVSFFFVPALVEAFHKRNHEVVKKSKKRSGRFARVWARLYLAYVLWASRHKWVLITVLVLAFGFPIFALPKEWKFPYREEISTWLGGTITLFAESLDANTYGYEKPEMQLHIRAELPQGGTAAQLNEKVLQLDEFLKGEPGIKRWVTTVDKWGGRIDVEFTPEALNSSMPYVLENKVIGRVIDIGGADWATYGVSERGFSNSLNLSYRNHTLLVSGYNYERLSRIAETLKDTLSHNPRVADLIIQSPGRRPQEDEFYAVCDLEMMTANNLQPRQVHAAIRDLLMAQQAGVLDDGLQRTDVMLKPSTLESFDMWKLGNAYVRIDSVDAKVGDLLSIEKLPAKNIIEKRNQEYVLAVAFNVIGSYTYAKKYIERTVDEFNESIPVGFKCEVASYGWYKDTGEQYWLLIVVVLVIYFLCGILFESWLRPLAIISLIPVSFIGVFVVFWATGVPFGTGGLASLVLLCGITINAAIYVLNEYDRLRKDMPTEPRAQVYVEAFNRKIVAVLLTIVSTVASLIPFLFDGAKEKFWFSFALGNIAGLAASLIALFLLLPIFLRLAPKSPKNKLPNPTIPQ